MVQEGEEKNICICPWDITAGRELLFFFFLLFPLLFYTSFWIMWKKRWLETCKYSAVIYGNQKYYSRLHLSYTLAKKASFQNISNTEELRQKGSDSDKKSKAVLYKETYLIRLQSRYRSIVKGLLYNASSLYLVFKTRRAAFCLTQGPERYLEEAFSSQKLVFHRAAEGGSISSSPLLTAGSPRAGSPRPRAVRFWASRLCGQPVPVFDHLYSKK